MRLAAECPHLNDARLDGCTVNVSRIITLMESCDITKLILYGCIQVTDLSAYKIIEKCSNLQLLNVRDSGITRLGNKALNTKFPK